VGLRVVLPGLDAMGIYHHVWFRQEYEKVARPKKGDVVVDVGAHIGLHLKVLEVLRGQPRRGHRAPSP